MSVFLIAAILSAVFLGSLTRTTFGFGDAVVSMPLLALLPIPLHTAIALMGLVSLTVAALTVTSGLRHIDGRELLRLVAAALLGIPVGLWMVAAAPTHWVVGLLGVALVVYGANAYASQRRTSSEPPPSRMLQPLWGWVLGFASGIFGSAYNFTGVPVAIYGTLRGWNPQRFRSTLQAYFLMAGGLMVAGQGLSGMWTLAVFHLYLLSLLVIVAAILLGGKLHRRIAHGDFRRYVFLLITALGAVLLFKSAL